MSDNPIVPGGEFAGRYRVEHELGRGGAAIVYLAHDERQDRQVAIKVLHKELGQAIGAQRFLREIKHTSALHHPHLLAIHESGEADGFLYYVMPYMQDGSLRARIAKEKQLSLDEALRVTRHVGEALAYAHSRGIVHRDIKPDNVLFSADHACLADFGIARAVDSVAADTLTSTGLVVGTPAYMSPEQASGERVVDARSDQYSLACLLYEMVTGLPPFIGATQQAIISQRFTQPPPSMRAHRPSVPDHVDRAVKRALAVAPADRFASVTDFIAALHDPSAVPEPVSVHALRRRWFAVGAAAALVTLTIVAARPGADWVRSAWGVQLDTAKVVVLPFLSEQDPAVGKRVAAGVHAALRGWDGLPVVGDAEVRDAIDEAGGDVSSLRDALAIARSLGAGKMIWGSASGSGDDARILAHVYDVKHAAELVERAAALPASTAADTSYRALANSLVGFGSLPPAVDGGFAGTRSYAALQAYRRGALSLANFDLEGARRDLRLAVRIDPAFAIAHLELARVESWLHPDSSSWHATVRRAAAHTRQLRPRDAIRAAALTAYAEKNYPLASRRYRELIAADTLDATAWHGLGECLHEDDAVLPDGRSPSGYRFRSSWHEAGVAFLRALEIEPRLHAVPHFRRLNSLFSTAHNQIRIDGEGKFAARPKLVADTIAYTPYAYPYFESEDDRVSRALHSRALDRNRRVLLELTLNWARTYPNSSEAHAALASALEVSGDFDAAIKSLGTARRFARSGVDQLLLADSEARVRLKNADYDGARRAAASALARFASPTESTWEPIARLAGLTGRSDLLAAALHYFWARHGGAGDLHLAVRRAAAGALARAVLGICEPRPPDVERSLGELIRIHVEPESQAAVAQRVTGLILSFSVPCATGGPVGNQFGPDAIDDAIRAFAAGNARRARFMMDSVERSRADVRAAGVSPTLVARESALLLALGDTARAKGRIDGTLRGLPGMSASVLRYPLENAVITRMMVTRAELAGGAGDWSEGRRWSQAAALLWADADPVLALRVSSIQKRLR